jgi:hypothetical protein
MGYEYGVWIRRMEIWVRGDDCGARKNSVGRGVCVLGWSCVDEYGWGKCALPRCVALRPTTLPHELGEQGICNPLRRE